MRTFLNIITLLFIGWPCIALGYLLEAALMGIGIGREAFENETHSAGERVKSFNDKMKARVAAMEEKKKDAR